MVIAYYGLSAISSSIANVFDLYKRLTTSIVTAICIKKYFIRVLVRSRQGVDMKVWRYVVFSLMVSFVILGGGICCKALADEGLPDGFKVLKEKKEKKEIPAADFAKFKFEIPDKLPDEITNLKGYLWSGTSSHPARVKGQGTATYLFLIGFNQQTGEMSFFRAWEAAPRTDPGWAILTGKTDTEDKGRIALTSKSGNPFTLLIKNKDSLVVRSPSGYEADMKKIGTINPPPK